MDTRLFTPAQLKAFTGLGVANQRVWHRQRFFHPEADADRPKGGHRRYTAFDMLHVCTVQAIAEDFGLPLSVASKVAEMCTDEVSSRLQGFPLLSHEITHPLVLIWRSRHTAASADWDSKAGGILREDAPEGYEIVRLSDERQMRRYTRGGGVIFPSASLVDRIPQAVLDLFLPEADGETE